MFQRNVFAATVLPTKSEVTVFKKNAVPYNYTVERNEFLCVAFRDKKIWHVSIKKVTNHESA